jgi:hypothetical protein
MIIIARATVLERQMVHLECFSARRGHLSRNVAIGACVNSVSQFTSVIAIGVKVIVSSLLKYTLVTIKV